MADELNINPDNGGQKDFEQILSERNKTVTQKSGGKKFLPGFIMIFAAVAIASIGYYAYQESIAPVDVSELPVIKAEKEGFKVEAKDSGEAEVPNMDKKVYDAISSTNEQPEKKLEEASVNSPGYEEPLNREAIAAVKEGTVTEQKENAKEILGTSETAAKKPVAANSDEVKSNVENSVISEVKSATEEQKEPAAKAIADEGTVINKEPVKEVPAEITPKKQEEKKVVKKVEKPKQKSTKETKAKPAAPKTYRIQLGAFPTEKEAKDLWNSLNKNNSDILGDLTAQIHKADLEKGTFFRLQAGTIANETEAKALCKKLQEKNQDCFVVRGN